MQICSRCNTSASDTDLECPQCKSALKEFSVTAVALKKLVDNPRVYAINLTVGEDACPACLAAQGTYPKDQAPVLPIEGCSHAFGCNCFYQPMLTDIFP